jgi:adenine-specific DNA-methyltransferase
MKKIDALDPLAISADLAAANVARLRALFPDLITEGPDGVRVNVDVLKQLIGDRTVTDADEKFGLSWSGKRRARQQALKPSTGTLRPKPQESVDWETTRNVLIEGDNLEVLKLLQKSYARRVKAIYIDPPYNTGRNLIYPNDYQDGIKTYLEITGQSEGGQALISTSEAGGRFHTNWLSMMYPRLWLARNLLTPDGVLIVTIDDNEQANLGVILREVFEEGTYEHVCVPIVHNPRGVQGTNFSYVHEYAFFVFKRGTKAISDRKIEESEIDWSHLRNWGGESERSDAKNCFYPILVKDGKIVGFGDVCKDDFHPRQTEVHGDVSDVYPIDKAGVERKWRYARQSVESIRHWLRARPTKTGYEIEIGKDAGLYKTIWNDKRYDANEYGTQIVSDLVPGSPFTFPKSLWAVYDSLLAVVRDDPEALVMDFFAGSGTTGHAVMEINKNVGGSRRFILVQLPEPIEAGGAYKTIFDVTKARVRAAGQRLNSAKVDVGFRVFSLDKSNIRAWGVDATTSALESELLVHENHLEEGRTESDIFCELLLKLGLDLSVPIETRTIAKKAVHAVGGGILVACLVEKIDRREVEGLARGIVEWNRASAPAGEVMCVFRDSAFEDDVAKTNMAAILEQHGLKNVRSL